MTNTAILGKKVIYLPSCHSTNDHAASLLGSPLGKEGTIVITSDQQKGRGQRGNSWESAPNLNLTFSIVLQPDFLAPHKQFQLNMAVSLAIIECFSNLIPSGLTIKWPNDIFCQDKKLGGILIENTLTGRCISHSIIGMGLNVNQQSFITPTATSLFLASGKHFDLTQLFQDLVSVFEGYYLRLKQGDRKSMEQSYLQNLYWYQEIRHFAKMENGIEGQHFQGQILGISPEGKLAIESNAKILYFGFKEVKFIA